MLPAQASMDGDSPAESRPVLRTTTTDASRVCRLIASKQSHAGSPVSGLGSVYHVMTECASGCAQTGLAEFAQQREMIQIVFPATCAAEKLPEAKRYASPRADQPKGDGARVSQKESPVLPGSLFDYSLPLSFSIFARIIFSLYSRNRHAPMRQVTVAITAVRRYCEGSTVSTPSTIFLTVMEVKTTMAIA